MKVLFVTSFYKFLLFCSLLLIFIFALSPGHFTPAFIVNHDKLAHLLALLTLSFMMQGALPSLALRFRVLALILLALSIECMQFLFTGRGFSGEDLLYDTAGIMLFIVISQFFRLIQKVRL